MAPRFSGAGRLNIALGAMARNVRPAIARALKRGALAIENYAVEGIIDPPKTGTIYGRNVNAGKLTKKGKRRKAKIVEHQASAPGEFPAADTGRLHQSITTVEVRNDDSAVVVETGANTPYAERLEFGGSHVAKNGKRVYIAPRPYMTPAFKANREAIKDMVTLTVAQEIRRNARGRS